MKINSIVNSISYFATPATGSKVNSEFTPQTEVGFHQFIQTDTKKTVSTQFIKVDFKEATSDYLLDLESIPILSFEEEIFLDIYLKIFGNQERPSYPMIQVDWHFPDGKIKSTKKKFPENETENLVRLKEKVPLGTQIEIKSMDQNKKIEPSTLAVFIKPVIHQKEIKIPSVEKIKNNLEVVSSTLPSSKRIITKVVKTKEVDNNLLEKNQLHHQPTIEAIQKGSIENSLKITQAQTTVSVINKDRLTDHSKVEQLSHSSNQERQPSK